MAIAEPNSESEDLANWWRTSSAFRELANAYGSLFEGIDEATKLLILDIVALAGIVEDEYAMNQRALKCQLHHERQPTVCPICALVECRIRFRYAKENRHGSF